MDINLDQEILSLDGNAIIGADQKPLTLAKASCDALLAMIPGDENMPGSRKVQLFELALRLTNAGTQKVTAEDVVTIKDRVARAFGQLVVGRVFAMLSE